MKERPINLRPHEAAAIVAGWQTQLRRIVRVPGRGAAQDFDVEDGVPLALCTDGETRPIPCPYGQPGDRLWGRETTIRVEDHGYKGPVYLASDDGQACLEWGLAPAPDDCTEVEPHELKLRPSIHMPRSMSRIALEIARVRVERVKSISEADAKAEGVDAAIVGGIRGASYRVGFQRIWSAIHGPGSWDAKWVWVIEFHRIET